MQLPSHSSVPPCNDYGQLDLILPLVRCPGIRMEKKNASFAADYILRGNTGTNQELRAWNRQDSGQRTANDKSWFT